MRLFTGTGGTGGITPVAPGSASGQRGTAGPTQTGHPDTYAGPCRRFPGPSQIAILAVGSEGIRESGGLDRWVPSGRIRDLA